MTSFRQVYCPPWFAALVVIPLRRRLTHFLPFPVSSLPYYRYLQVTGNFPTVTRVLLAKIPPADARMSYVYDQCTFHYVVSQGITYLCMSQDGGVSINGGALASTPQGSGSSSASGAGTLQAGGGTGAMKHRMPFNFLREVEGAFVQRYGGQAHTAIAYSMNDEFSRVLKKFLEEFNDNPLKGDNIAGVQSQINSVKEVMVRNIEQVLERGEKIELLVDKTDKLNQQAFKFEKQSKRLKNAMWWRKIKMYAAVAFVVGLVIFIITVFGCGGITFPNCKSK